MKRLAVACVLLVLSCKSAPRPEAGPRVIEDPARGVRYTAPAGWRDSDGEILSAAGSLLTLRVYDLVEADKQFVAGLPDTLMPQLEGWAKHYYVVDGPPTRSDATVGGEPSTEFNYPIRVRKGDPPSKVTYWVTRHGTRLFLIRVAYPAKALVADEPVARSVVDGWQFLP